MSKKNNKIVFINQSSGYLMIDIVNAFKTEYTDAILIAGQVIKRYVDLDEYVKVDLIVPYKKQSTIKRISSWLIATIQILVKLKFKYGKEYDVFLVSNPPFTTILPLFLKRKYSLLVYDTYPDVLVTHGILKENSFITKWWKKINCKVFKKAANIYTISNGMADCLSQYVDRANIKVIPNWSNTSFLKPLEKALNPFVQEHKLNDKFVVLYSGNMGATHDVEAIVEVAKLMQAEKDIVFVFIGEGAKKEKIQKTIKEHNLNNCVLLPYQDSENLPFSLSSADIGVVTLDKETSLLSVPSKIYSLMAVGAVFLCIGDKHSELGNIVKNYNIGDIFDKNSITEMKDFIIKVKNNKDLQNQLSSNSRKASFEFSEDNALLYAENYN